ncbi:hypothetical protein Zm00014a_008597 [Zea mays]|uniref:Uncharacterized protein n=1 Tax=Zea mays TaxID=4577 RepID=A0A3L6EAB8_MAIZE|nr:hypothetical protein Zm00014a_008597 [Zea mays]
MAATGGVSTDDIPILQAENLTSNVKSVHYRCLVKRDLIALHAITWLSLGTRG